MSINIRNKQPTKPHSSISQRKQDHIDICKQDSLHQIESTPPCGFDSLTFIHSALPEINGNEISTQIDFLGKKINLPLFISCMTGGSEEGYLANKTLAKAAQQMKVPIGLGSMRVLFSNPERIKDFSIRAEAPDVPILGNIGAVQVRDSNAETLKKIIHQLEVDALVIHLNCGQELFQLGGDADFKGLKLAISRAVKSYSVPIIVKETGFGIRPSHVKELIEMGVAYVDVAGAGGTNWILVENSREDNRDAAAAEFVNWGISTPLLLDAVKSFPGKIIASGGLRSGMDLAKSLALGAIAGGMALPFIRSALDGGQDCVCTLIETYEKVLRTVMILTGCKTISELQKIPLLKSPLFEHYVSSFQAIDF